MSTQLLAIVLLTVTMMVQFTPASVSLEGDVVGRLTGESIAGVRIQLQGVQRLSAITDASGHFRFPAIPAVSCFLYASGAELLPRSQALTIRPTDTSIYLKLEMTRQAVISGKVVDQDGWPVPGTRVSAAHYTTLNGQRQIRVDGIAETNDLGEYRLARLGPGKYYVHANPSFIARSWDERNNAVWYPNTPKPAEARAIELQAGQLLHGIDIRMSPQPGVQMRGRVVWPTTYQRSRVEQIWLRQQLLNGSSTTSYTIAADDSFTLRHLAPGKYTLLVEVGGDVNNLRPPRYWASRTLEVSDENIEDLTLSPVETPVRDLNGAVSFKGIAQPLPCRVHLQRVGANWQASANAETDGSFVLPGVWPGSYRLSASCPDTSTISVRFREKDILDTEFEFDGSVPGPIQITVGTLGHIGGTLTDAENRPVAGAMLVFLPVGKGTRWSATTDQNGTIFSMASPGLYRLYVIEEPLRSDLVDDPEFQTTHQNDFPPVTVTAGVNEHLKLVLRRM